LPYHFPDGWAGIPFSSLPSTFEIPCSIFDILFFLPKGVDFLSQSVVKIYFRERPAMIRRRKTELAWLKRFEIPEHPLRAGAYAELEPAMIRWIKNEK
jgi:hypothetical protein